MTVQNQRAQSTRETDATEAAPTANGSSRAHLGLIAIGGLMGLVILPPLGLAILLFVALFWTPAGRLDAGEQAVDEGHTPTSDDIDAMKADSCLGYLMGAVMLVIIVVMIAGVAVGGGL